MIVLLPNVISKVAEKVTAAIVFVTTSILYVAAFPFYRQFHSNFNQMIFNAANDDLYALFVTLIDEFYLPLRLLMALILSMILYKLWIKCLQLQLKIHSLLVIALTYLAVTLSIFGGGFLLSEEAKAEKITADKAIEKAKAEGIEKAKAEGGVGTIVWGLSEREREIIRGIGK